MNKNNNISNVFIEKTTFCIIFLKVGIYLLLQAKINENKNKYSIW